MTHGEYGVWLSIVLLAALLVTVLICVWFDVLRSGHRLKIYLGFRGLWLFCKLLHGVRPRGPDPLPASGPVLLISNHTSTVDPLFLQCATRRVISFLMAREYYDIRFLRPLYHLIDPILVNRTGRDTAAMRATLRALGDGRVIGVFPEGGIHLDPQSLGAAKPGTAMLALLTKVPVVPVFIDRPERTNRLVRGLLRPVKTRLFFGRPLDLRAYYDGKRDAGVLQEVTDLMMQSIERLRPTATDSD